MFRCPECGQEIEWLELAHRIFATDAVSLDRDGNFCFKRMDEEEEEEEEGEGEEYLCPKCYVILAYTIDDAEKLLRGNEAPKMEKENMEVNEKK